jgi:hypothetical protein
MKELNVRTKTLEIKGVNIYDQGLGNHYLIYQKYKQQGIPTWQLEGGSRKRVS